MKKFSKKEVMKKIAPVIENTAMRCSLIPLEITLEKENGHWFLRIFIYSNNHPVSHLDCENISHSLDGLLDDIIPFKYYLEISSPGLEKRLKTPREFQIFKGHKVVIKLKNPLETGKTLKGVIADYNNAFGFKIATDEGEFEIALDNIFSIKLNDIE